MNVRIVESGCDDLRAYESVSIAFEIASKVSLDKLRSSQGKIVSEEFTETRWKDYDSSPQDRPTALSARWDTSNWVALSAFDADTRLGGAILARETPGLDMLEGRNDLGLIFDLRVRHEFRGTGVGRTLFDTAKGWARRYKCVELRVETQDVNVAACRFYAAMGCTLRSIEEGAYEGLDEAKLIWRMFL